MKTITTTLFAALTAAPAFAGVIIIDRSADIIVQRPIWVQLLAMIGL